MMGAKMVAKIVTVLAIPLIYGPAAIEVGIEAVSMILP
jgi:hypothetical protein